MTFTSDTFQINTNKCEDPVIEVINTIKPTWPLDWT
jgi:hypothetical protein